MRISIIHPSRSRPLMAKQTIHKWLSSAHDRDSIEYILSVDSTDPLLAEYEAFAADMGVLLHIGDNKTAIEAINSSARLAAHNFYPPDLFVCVSDDFACPYHWDKALNEALEGKSDYVAKTVDGLQPWIVTLPIMDLTYYKRYGYIYNPIYKHMFSDCELAHVATITDKLIYVDIRFPHNHYATGMMAKDSVNEKNDSTWNQGEQVYLDRLVNYFDIPESERINPINKIPAHHAQWLHSKGVKFTVA